MRLFMILIATGCGVLLVFRCSSVEEKPIPDGAIWKQETVRRAYSPTGYQAVLCWMQAATIKTGDEADHNAFVTIDRMAIVESDGNGNNLTVYSQSFTAFNGTPLPADHGGLYKRFPKWFDDDTHSPIWNSEIRNGSLTLFAGKSPDNILHWWTKRIQCRNDRRYYLEVRMQISGKCAVQCGSDFWRDTLAQYNIYDPTCINSNNCEAWISDWYNDTKGSFISIKVPIK